MILVDGVAGDWTSKLYEICKQQVWVAAQQQSQNAYGEEEDFDVEMRRPNRYELQVDVNGPFGAPAQDYSHYNVLLLVVCGALLLWGIKLMAGLFLQACSAHYGQIQMFNECCAKYTTLSHQGEN